MNTKYLPNKKILGLLFLSLISLMPACVSVDIEEKQSTNNHFDILSLREDSILKAMIKDVLQSVERDMISGMDTENIIKTLDDKGIATYFIALPSRDKTIIANLVVTKDAQGNTVGAFFEYVADQNWFDGNNGMIDWEDFKGLLKLSDFEGNLRLVVDIEHGTEISKQIMKLPSKYRRRGAPGTGPLTCYETDWYQIASIGGQVVDIRYTDTTIDCKFLEGIYISTSHTRDYNWNPVLYGTIGGATMRVNTVQSSPYVRHMKKIAEIVEAMKKERDCIALAANRDEAETIDHFYNENKGLKKNTVVTQADPQGFLDSRSGGPNARYIVDPLNPNIIIDMRHMLIMGELGRFAGDPTEWVQHYFNRPSGIDYQDFYSNELGYLFYQRYEQKIRNNPHDFVKYVREFLYNRSFRNKITTPGGC